MKSCPEGAFTSGHLWMAVFGGLLVGFVIAAVLSNKGLLREPPA